MTTFEEDPRTAHKILTELIEHTSTDYLDAHFPMEWSHDQIADAILRRHCADILTREASRGDEQRHEEAGQTAQETQDPRTAQQ